MSFEEWLRVYPDHKYHESTIKRYIRALDKAGEWLQVELPEKILEITEHEKLIAVVNKLRRLPNYEDVNLSHGNGVLSAAIRLYCQFLKGGNDSTTHDALREKDIKKHVTGYTLREMVLQYGTSAMKKESWLSAGIRLAI